MLINITFRSLIQHKITFNQSITPVPVYMIFTNFILYSKIFDSDNIEQNALITMFRCLSKAITYPLQCDLTATAARMTTTTLSLFSTHFLNKLNGP